MNAGVGGQQVSTLLGTIRSVGLDAGLVGNGSMTGHDPTLSLADNYRRFATIEAAGRSPAYQQLASAVAEDGQLLSFLESLPLEKRQPNLLFAAARLLLAVPPEIASLRHLVVRRPEELTSVMITRRTQTNEAARCALLLPALAAISGPLALLEVGAAAGLNLLVDHYSYRYRAAGQTAGDPVAGDDPEAPVLVCRTSGPVPLPRRLPEVVWRAGVDLNPLDVDDPGDVEWLQCLVWPGEADRAQRLAAAIETARRWRPTVHRGDLVDDLAKVARDTPPGATLVIYHCAVLAYVERARRVAFADAVAELGARWLSCEASGVVSGAPSVPTDDGGFALVADGVELLATADPHGTWLNWVT